MDDPALQSILDDARRLAAAGEDEAAKHCYVDLLQREPTHYAALLELGILAHASGHVSAAKTVFAQAVQHHPYREQGRLNLAHVLAEEGDLTGAKLHYLAVLATQPDCAAAHQGVARIFEAAGDARAATHWRHGSGGPPVWQRPYRGAGQGAPVLLLTAAQGGNVPTRHWVHDRAFAIAQIHAEFAEADTKLPPHALAINAIGDADRSGPALDRAEALLARSAAPVINPPERVRRTGRAENAARLGAVAGVRTPRMMLLPRDRLAEATALGFPLLLRAPGHHTGQHFLHVDSPAGLAAAATALPGARLLAIEYLDARGWDGRVRKYRVMFVDGALLPLHLAIGHGWKLHYFSADMAADPALRAEERRFLDDLPGVLGVRAMAALRSVAAMLGLDYAGADFALAPDGSVLLFEANATMVVNPPDAGAVWDYRRPAVAAVMGAIEAMLRRRIAGAPGIASNQAIVIPLSAAAGDAAASCSVGGGDPIASDRRNGICRLELPDALRGASL